ncbi:diacylglycerol kinase [Chromobacterium phragmitis]|uniref:Dihydrofolate reductase n=1 Tax=Chromobacterium phragmitis TaxID=2202141 RepID=A0A344ULA2_9NEIS|nr:dihydrofolate reductase [Chromobacterium phragmitis]AXE30679.1 diacylglycerol kinase [Chromobacterium phragmitis]AXE36050.1 diacylglycerol kinase [Chromobacterium phragmitis]
MSQKPILTLVAAMAANRTIGVDNKLPWHLPEDLKHFKAATLGKPVIMGRKTWDSIGRPLPGRRNIVVTRQADWAADGAEAAHSLEEALTLAGGVEEACLIGGADLYRQALAMADRLCLTEIGRDYDGDAHFPVFSPEEWREASREEALSAAGLPYAFVEYRRR